MLARISLLIGFCFGSCLYAEDIILNPSKDNSLFEEGNLSNGLGTFLFSGNTAARNSGAGRRALIQFDVAGSIPAGATIDSAKLTLNVSKSPPGAPDHDFSLHKLVSDWGEGLSRARGAEGRGAEAAFNDATWTNAFSPSTGWNTPGGDFITDASAMATVGSSGRHDWVSDQLIADVQSWLDSPEANFGWIVVGDESQDRTARRFDSSEHSNAANFPALAISFSVGGGGLLGDFNGDQVLDAADIDILSEAIRNQSNDSQFDVNSDGLINSGDHSTWVVELRKTYFGDADMDGEFGTTDFVSVFAQGEYEDETPFNSTWASGDWNGDGDFNTNDFVTAFADGGFEQGPRVAAAAPEPSGFALLGISLIALLRFRVKKS